MKTAIILGGGISGLSAVIKLKSLGYRTILIEKDKLCTHVGGGIDIHPNGTKVLFSLGAEIERKIKKHNQYRLREITISSAEGKTLNRVPLPFFEMDPDYPLVSFFRHDLLKILFEAAPIDELYEYKRCTQITIDKNGVEVFVEGLNNPLKADLLIGSDGINSIARKAVNPEIKKSYLGHISLGGCVSREYYKHNYIHGLNRSCVVLPCSENACHTVMFLPKPKDWLKNNTKTFQQQKALFLGWSHEVDNILDHLEAEHQFCVESYEIPPLDFYAKGPVFLIGDAAHAMSPLGALATCLALEDVEELSESLLTLPSIEQAAKTYHLKRAPRIKQFRDFSWQFLLPPILHHREEEYRSRMARFEITPSEKVFSALIELTQTSLIKEANVKV